MILRSTSLTRKIQRTKRIPLAKRLNLIELLVALIERDRRLLDQVIDNLLARVQLTDQLVPHLRELRPFLQQVLDFGAQLRVLRYHQVEPLCGHFYSILQHECHPAVPYRQVFQLRVTAYFRFQLDDFLRKLQYNSCILYAIIRSRE